jgi:hypothetical protein
MASEHDKLLPTEVRRLSRENVLSRLFELRAEVQIFLSNTASAFRSRFTDEMWLSRLAYLADIFCHLVSLTKALQGFSVTPFSVHDKTEVFRKNLVPLSKKQEVEKCLPFHFWTVSA